MRTVVPKIISKLSSLQHAVEGSGQAFKEYPKGKYPKIRQPHGDYAFELGTIGNLSAGGMHAPCRNLYLNKNIFHLRNGMNQNWKSILTNPRWLN